MANSQFFYDKKGNHVEIWHEVLPNEIHYWKKINDISWALSKRQYTMCIKKNGLITINKLNS